MSTFCEPHVEMEQTQESPDSLPHVLSRHNISSIRIRESRRDHYIPNPNQIMSESKQVRATIVRKDNQGKLGIGFGEQGSSVIIAHVKKDSVFAGSGLKKGMQVLSINDIPVCSGGEAALVATNTDGILSIVAQDIPRYH